MATNNANTPAKATANVATPTPTDYVRIVNHHSATLGLPPVAVTLSKEDAERTGRSTAVKVRDRILNPGENNVSAEHWNAIKDQSPVKDWMAAGLLSVGDASDTSKPEGPVEPNALSDLSPAKAVEYINTTTDKDKLVSLSKDEKRPEVQQALQRRIEALGVPK